MQLVNQHVAVILPLVNNLFLIFFFRQNFKSFPDGILDASRIEGATEYTIFFRIVFPMMRSTYAAAAIYAFMNAWNSSSNHDIADFQFIVSQLRTKLWRSNAGDRDCNDPNVGIVFVYAKRLCERHDRFFETISSNNQLGYFSIRLGKA